MTTASRREGDKPVIYLTIEAKDGYQLSGTKLQPSRLTKLRSDLAIRASGKLRLRCQLLTAIWIRSRILAGAITATWDSVSDASK